MDAMLLAVQAGANQTVLQTKPDRGSGGTVENLITEDNGEPETVFSQKLLNQEPPPGGVLVAPIGVGGRPLLLPLRIRCDFTSG